MAWIERVDKRERGNKTFEDDANPLVFQGGEVIEGHGTFDAQAGTAWHYEDSPESGVFANEVDLTPERVLAGGHDGWRITQNGWHYFLGQPNGLADGFVGFGGRQGDKWLLFRLLRVGYLHWPTRAWDDIGGAPTYSRGSLGQAVETTKVNTTDEDLPVESTATWSDIWNTPGGGALDIRWRVDGNRLKEDIVVNQAARTWIGANRPPATPASETYFGFVFRLGSAPDVNNIEMDLSYLPRWLKNGIVQDTEGDFDDDDGTAPIEVQNALQEFLFLLPISEAYVDEIDGEDEITRTSIKLRKRIYKDGANYYLCVGAKVSDLVGLPAGDLVFDPTIDQQVAADNVNAWEDTGTVYTTGGRQNAVDEYYSAMFLNLTMSGTIDTAYVEFYLNHAAMNEPNETLWCDDTQTPALYDHSSPPNDQISGRTPTTATTPWGDGTDTDTVDFWGSTQEAKTVVQELVDSYTYDGDDAICFVLKSDPGDMRADLYADSSANAPKVHIEYTVGGGPSLEMGVVFHHLNKNIGR